ncbi:MAG TPA: hypothetical protein VF618_02595 [Thermoanaerobaculia bacterium]
MTTIKGAGAAALALAAILATGCTGGTESNAATEEQAQAAAAAEAQAKKVDVRQELAQINEAIPVYSGAEYRDDLTRRDETMIRNQYGQQAQVYTLASDDSFPQVYHYYTTYLAQFGGFGEYDDRYPRSKDNWRTLQVQLNQAMQEPFVPGTTLALNGKQVILQIVETEADPRTVVRYIVTPPGAGAPQPVTTASAGVDPQQSIAR